MRDTNLTRTLNYELTAGRVYTGRVKLYKQRGGGYTHDVCSSTGREVAELSFDRYRLTECLPLATATPAEKLAVREFAALQNVPDYIAA